MNDYCQQLFDQDSVNFNECTADDEEEEQQDQGDDAYTFYSYDIEDADDMEEVCAKIVSFNIQYSNYYDSAGSGSPHTRDKNGNLVSSESTSLSVGAIAAIVVACVVDFGAASLLMPKKKRVKASALHEPVYQGRQHS